MKLFGDNSAIALTVEGMALRGLVYADRNIKSWFNIPLSPDTVRGGVILAPEKVGKIIAEAIEERNLPRKGVLAAIPSSGCNTETLSFPQSSKVKLEELVKREIRRLGMAKLEDNYLHWQTLPKKGDKQQVYALTTPKVNVLNLVEACRVAGMKLKVIELKPYALARAVNCKEGIIAHGEMDHIEIIIVDNFSASVFRGIPLEVSQPDWEIATSQVIRELPITIDYYNHMHRDSPLSSELPIYLTGELALDPVLSQKVADAAKRSVSSLEPPITSPENFPTAQYMTGIGLMLRS